MKKRLLSVVLAFTLCFGMMPVTVLAEEMGNAETVALALDDQVVVRAVNSTHEGCGRRYCKWGFNNPRWRQCYVPDE